MVKRPTSALAKNRSTTFSRVKAGRAALAEGGDALGRIEAVRLQLLGHRLSNEGCRSVAVERTVEQLLGQRERRRRRGGEALEQCSRGGVELRRRHHAVDQSELACVGGGELVAEEGQLLGALQTHETRQQVSASTVDHQAAQQEGLEEVRRVCRGDEIARKGEVRAESGRGTLDDGDHGLGAVEHRSDQSLRAVLDAAHAVADDRLGGLGAADRTDIRTRAEVTTLCAQPHRPHGAVGARTGEQLDDDVALLGEQRVACVGPAHRDRRHARGDLVQHGVAQRAHQSTVLLMSVVRVIGPRCRSPRPTTVLRTAARGRA